MKSFKLTMCYGSQYLTEDATEMTKVSVGFAPEETCPMVASGETDEPSSCFIGPSQYGPEECPHLVGTFKQGGEWFLLCCYPKKA